MPLIITWQPVTYADAHRDWMMGVSGGEVDNPYQLEVGVMLMPASKYWSRAHNGLATIGFAYATQLLTRRAHLKALREGIAQPVRGEWN